MNAGPILIWAAAVETAFLFALSKRAVPAFDYWQLAAQLTGIFGLFTLSWTYILAVRHAWVERLFGGLDKQYRTHHILGGVAFLLLINHPLFLILRQLPTNTLALYLVPGTTFPYTLGIFALYVFVLLIVLTLYVDMPYRTWKQTHEWMGLVILLGAWHGLIVSSDMAKFLPLTLWMSVWSVLAIAAYVYKRFIYYMVGTGKRYVLDDVLWEKDIVIVTLRATNPSDIINFQSGQFGFLSFDSPKSARDEHPFSVVSCQGEVVRFGIKVTGGFTLGLAQSAIGTRVCVRGPFGTFGSTAAAQSYMLWVAGGIGITPFISLLSRLGPHQHVTLIHSVRGDAPRHIVDLVRQLLEKLPGVSFIVHDTQQAGRLTARRISSYMTLTSSTRVWLCGPPAMMAGLTDELSARGIRRKHISYEDFSLR